ncbi:MAG: IPT/TIG domain-containing protein [Chloroflexota bacterium]
MKRRTLAPVAVVLISMTALLVLLGLLSSASRGRNQAVLAAPSALKVTGVEPSSAPNDLDAPIVISGTDFADSATVQLGRTALEDAGWVSSATLTATVPWGLDPGFYTLTVENPDGTSASLTDAFTVTQALGVWNAGELYGGDVRRVFMNPVTPTTLYVTPLHIGLFRSRDGGANWTFLSDTLDRPVAIDPNDPSTLYAFGLEPQRSDDEGESWTSLSPTFPNSPTLGGGCQSSVELYPHPETAGKIYATSCGGPFKGSGVLSSTNQGEDWEQAMEGLTDTQVTSLAFHPVNPLTIYAGTANGNVFISQDGGAHWSFASQPVEYVGQLAVNPFEPHDVWVSSDVSWGAPAALLKSTDADLTGWTSTLPGPEAHWGSENGRIVFPPKEGWGEEFSGTVFLATGVGGGYRTTDGGDEWTSFGPTEVQFLHDFALHPSDPQTIYAAESQQAVYKTTDGGENWQVSNRGLTGVKPGQLETVPGEPEVVYAQSHGAAGIYKAVQGGQTWHFLPILTGGTPESILVDPVTTTRVYVGEYAGIHISEDAGQSWTFVKIDPPDQYLDCGLFVQALEADPATDGAMLAGMWHDCGSTNWGSIYRSEDYGESWTRIELGYEISRVNEIAYDPVSPTIVYAGTEDPVMEPNGLHRSVDGGLEWERVGENVPGLGSVGDIAIESTSPHRVFASAGLPGGNGGLFCSEDHGRSAWEEVDLPDSDPDAGIIAAVGRIAVAPGTGDTSVLYAVGEPDAGLFQLRLTDSVELTGTLSWEHAAGALGQVPIYSLATVTDTDRVFLYAGTTGGRVEETGSQVLGTAALGAATEERLVNAGVYRYTTPSGRKVYLPLLLKP